MDQQDKLLKRTEEDTTDILLEYIADAQDSEPCNKSRSRTKSVEVARAFLRHSAPKEEVITETESEGFVVLSKTTRIASSSCTSTCGQNNTSTKRPATLALQSAADPGDPPLFSPCQSYPPPSTAGRMPLHSQSSPTLSGGTVRIVPSCDELSRSLSQMSTATTISESQQLCARVIAERLKAIGDSIEKTKNKEEIEQNLASLVGLCSRQSLWQNVTRTFSSIYNILSILNQEFGDSHPPSYDEGWQLFCKALGVLRDSLIPQISSLGGWSAFLRESSDSPVVLASTSRSHDHHMIGSPCIPRTLPVSQSTPSTTARHRLLQEYQPSPGSQRSLKINRSHTLPSIERHPLKLWRLSESGSLIDEDGNDDFCESLKREKEERESDFESSGLSLDNAGQLVDQYSDDESEKDDLVFSMEPVTSLNSPVVVPSPHCQEANPNEPLCDSGHVSSWETLSSSSTPPRDVVSFVLGGTPHCNDSAVDVSHPQTSGGKRRPKSGCTFGKKDEVPAFDRHRVRSRSMPISKRPRSSGSDKSRRRSPVVVLPSPHDGSISLSGISETVMYEAVRSLFT